MFFEDYPLDEQIEKLISQRVQLELQDSRRVLDAKILDVVNSHSARGVLQSSMTAEALVKIVAEDARDRIRAIWGIIHRTTASANVEINEQSEQDLAKLLVSLAKENTDDLPAYYKERTSKYVRNGLVDKLAPDVESAIENETEIQLNELKLFALNYRNRSEASAGPTVNVYGTAGSIQTGSHAVANVNIQVKSAGELKQLLENIERDLDSIDGFPEADREEIKAVILDGKTELDKPAPNKTRIKGSLSGIADALRQADSALKGVERIYEWGRKVSVIMEKVGEFL